jgi:hypothetical protein
MKANAYAIDERVFAFYSVILGQVCEEKLKITNSSKVPCVVNLSIQGRRGTKEDTGGFDIKPKKLNIGPQEHSYVTVTFAPTGIRAYSAVFEALVQGGIDPKTNKLTFELRGSSISQYFLIFL